MRTDDPLDTILDPVTHHFLRRSPSKRLRAALKRLRSLLRKPTEDLSNAGFHRPISRDGILSPEMASQAEALYWQVAERGGPGSQLTREGMLLALAMTGASASLPFWEQALEHSMPRDRFRKRQQELAVAGIALIARQDDGAEARQRLRSLASCHPEPRIQAAAVRGLWLHRELPLPADVVALLTQLAAAARRPLPRHMARRGLKLAQHPVPLDHPGGSIIAELRLKRGRSAFSASLEVATDSSLHRLHLTIQDALGWDADHLYLFSVTDDPRDPAGSISGLSPFGDSFDERGLPDAGDWCVGELGLDKGASLSYLFDFGDKHRLDIKITEIRSKPTGELPRVLSRKGRQPAQYSWG